MWKAVLTIFCLLYIGVQLTCLESNSNYTWLFLIGDVILGLALFVMQWIQTLSEEDENERRKN